MTDFKAGLENAQAGIRKMRSVRNLPYALQNAIFLQTFGFLLCLISYLGKRHCFGSILSSYGLF